MELGGVVMSMDEMDFSTSSDSGNRGNRHRSGFLKHGRGNVVGVLEEQDWRLPKLARNSGVTSSEAAVVSEAIKVAAPFLLAADAGGGNGEHMLSFSSSRSGGGGSSDVVALPLYYTTAACSSSCSSSAATISYLRSEALSSGSFNTSMHGAMSRVRGPFTPSQWMELEHQALIYKYLAANSPIPNNLLTPIRGSFSSPYSSAYYGTTPLGWGSFHLGYSGGADPEPGRCRRTDGKKWRCSRDAVADQKYCERHMNRGRHRSRKHVEGQSGHAAKAITNAASTCTIAQLTPAVANLGSSPTAEQQTMKNYGTSLIDACSQQFNRTVMTKESVNEQVQDSESLSMLTSMNLRNMSTLFPASKQHHPFEQTNSGSDFSIAASASLMNSPRNSSENISFLAPTNHEEQPANDTLQHFMNDWPKNCNTESALSWPEVEDMQSRRTELSIAIPMAASADLSSAGDRTEASHGEANWTPMFREASLGGPLGEVLNKNNTSSTNTSKNCLSSSLKLLTDGWDSSPRMQSPTGVLQKTAFGSVSSSTGSSPRPENNSAYDGIGNLREDLGSILVNHLSLRSM